MYMDGGVGIGGRVGCLPGRWEGDKGNKKHKNVLPLNTWFDERKKFSSHLYACGLCMKSGDKATPSPDDSHHFSRIFSSASDLLFYRQTQLHQHQRIISQPPFLTKGLLNPSTCSSTAPP